MKSVIFSDNAFYYSILVPTVSNFGANFSCLAGKVFSSGEEWSIENSPKKQCIIGFDYHVVQHRNLIYMFPKQMWKRYSII